jgi:hypothetical protein
VVAVSLYIVFRAEVVQESLQGPEFC